MRNPCQQLEALDAEIRVLEKLQGARWTPRLIELLERRAELRRELDLDLQETYGT